MRILEHRMLAQLGHFSFQDDCGQGVTRKSSGFTDTHDSLRGTLLRFIIKVIEFSDVNGTIP